MTEDSRIDSVSLQFRKLAREVKVYRQGIGFYTLRHVFQTIADEARDPIATKTIMGHADDSMSASYRERVSDDNLQAVANHVRQWLFPTPKPATKDVPALRLHVG